MSAPLTNDPVSRPYKVVTEVEEHACPSCHQDAPGHIVVGPDDIGFGTTYYGDDGKDEADDLADMLNDAYEAGRESVTALDVPKETP